MDNLPTLEEYPFLKAGLEDAVFISEISTGRWGTARHAVCLMHDAIEFTLYEILLLENKDIYSSGQNTIGLDRALDACRKVGVDIPLIGTIRTIQKHRGDAKHHAQVPHESAYRKMIGEFRIVMSRLIHEQFGKAFGSAIGSLGLLIYHTALYETYRKYRNHNSKLALRFGTGALFHKHRSILGLPEDYIGGRTVDTLEVLRHFGVESHSATYPPAPSEAIEFVHELPSSLRKLVLEKKISEAAEEAGRAYSKLDEILPSVFDIKKSKKYTSRLVQPQNLIIRGAMAWSRWEKGDTVGKEDYNSRLRSLLKDNSQLISKFGAPYYEEDDDRYWRWWLFAVFDGEKWHTFRIDDHFDLSLEMGSIDDDDSKRREKVAKLICEEFEKAVHTS